MVKKNKAEKWLTTDEAVEMLRTLGMRISKRTMENWACGRRRAGELPFTMILHRRMYLMTDLEKFVESHKKACASA